jgi:hypothetical protein
MSGWKSEKIAIFIACGVAALLLLAAGILPQYLSIRKEEHRIAGLKAQLEQQKVLQPLYRSIAEKASFEAPEGLPNPKPAGMARSEVGRLPEMFAAAADKYGLILENVMPRVDALREGTDHLPVDLILRGDFFKFRDFLIELGAMPFLYHVEKAGIERTTAGNLFELRVWLTLQ